MLLPLKITSVDNYHLSKLSLETNTLFLSKFKVFCILKQLVQVLIVKRPLSCCFYHSCYFSHRCSIWYLPFRTALSIDLQLSACTEVVTLSAIPSITYGKKNLHRTWSKVSFPALSFVLVNQSVIRSTWQWILTTNVSICVSYWPLTSTEELN